MDTTTLTNTSAIPSMASGLARLFNSSRSRYAVVQTLVSVTLSYQLLYGDETLISRDTCETLVAGLMVLILAVAALPRLALESRWLPGALIAANTIAVTGTIYLSGSTKSELLFSYFLLMLIAGSARTLGQLLGLSLVLCVGSGALLYESVLETGVLSVGHLLGIPMLLVMAVFYGVTLESLMQERRWKTLAAEDVTVPRETEETLRFEREQQGLNAKHRQREQEQDVSGTGALEQQIGERHLREARRMEAYSRIAGSIAGEFGELLGVVGNRAALILSRLKPTDPLYPSVEEIFRAGERASTLTAQLVTLNRGDDRPLEPVRLDTILAELRGLLQGVLPSAIQLRMDLDPKPLPVYADRELIEQLVLHLVINARDAMPKGGQVTIETKPVRRQLPSSATHKPSQPSKALRLSVCDTGCGMTAETQARMFEPLFSTKSASAGLGFPTVYHIVKKFDGHLEVESRLGQGTTIHVYLPQAEGQVRVQQESANRALMANGNETVLLVEEDEVLRKLAVSVLARHKYQVLESGSPVEALLVSQQHSGSIHVVVCHQVMPEISGQELAQRLLTQRSGIKVLYVSGYPEDATMHDRMRPRFLLPHPYRQYALLEKVRDVLDAA